MKKYKIFLFGIIAFGLIGCKGSKASKQAEVQDPVSHKNDLASPDISGQWKMMVVTPVGIHYPDMFLTQEGNIASGDLSGNPVIIKLLGDSLSFSSSRKTPIGTFNFDYTGRLITKDSMNGIFNMRGGPFANKDYDWTASRNIAPE